MADNAPRRLRELMKSEQLVWGPGVYDGISAYAADDVGFPMLYMTGAGTAASRAGYPDFSIQSLTEMVDNARMIARISKAPVIADADTGFGGPLTIARTVYEYEAAGLAGLHIEDQAYPKRCGHLKGKIIVPIDEFEQRIRAAVLARRNPDFLIIARTDARKPNGFEDAIERMRRAFAAGADVGFLESPQSLEEIKRSVAESAGPMLLNLAANGDTPNLRVNEVRELGFKLAIYPGATMFAAARHFRDVLSGLKRDGTDANLVGNTGPREFFNMVGMQDCVEFDETVGSKSLSMV
jgi:2,3-dimethylmalate lyase